MIFIFLLLSISISSTTSSVPSLLEWKTTSQKVAVCRAYLEDFPTVTPCSSIGSSSAEVCGDSRCCWVESKKTKTFSCIKPFYYSDISEQPSQAELDESHFYGGGMVPASLSNADSALAATNDGGILSVECLNSPPVMTSCAPFPSQLLIDGASPVLHETQWQPFQLVRSGTTGKIEVSTSIRMPLKQPIVLFEMELKSLVDTHTSVSMKLPIQARSYHDVGWEWGHPSPDPKQINKYPTELTENGDALLTCDRGYAWIDGLVEVAPCNTADPNQQWSSDLNHSVIKNIGTGQCLTTGLEKDPLTLADCSQTDQSQLFFFNRTTHMFYTEDEKKNRRCIDLNHGVGPDIDWFNCHKPSDFDFKNQQFEFIPQANGSGQIRFYNSDNPQCLVVKKYKPKVACAGVSFASGDDYASCQLSLDSDGIGSASCTDIFISKEESTKISLVLRIGLEADNVDRKALQVAQSFKQEFSNAPIEMDAWWNAAFDPEPNQNQFWSGYLPTLDTNDDQLARAYYGSLMSFLLVARHPMSQNQNKTDVEIVKNFDIAPRSESAVV